MKCSIAFAAALCVPAVMAAAVDTQAAVMQALMTEVNGIKSLVSQKCPDLDSQCGGELDQLLSGLSAAAGKQDTKALQSSIGGFTQAIQSNPRCAEPVIKCIQSMKSGNSTASTPAAATPTPKSPLGARGLLQPGGLGGVLSGVNGAVSDVGGVATGAVSGVLGAATPAVSGVLGAATPAVSGVLGAATPAAGALGGAVGNVGGGLLGKRSLRARNGTTTN